MTGTSMTDRTAVAGGVAGWRGGGVAGWWSGRVAECVTTQPENNLII